MQNNVKEISSIVREYTADYSKYVATSRAVPSLIDGLKPVQRRLLNTANDLKIYHDKKFLKVSKIEGQVLGDYHPHGGASVAGLVQPFTMRYPIFEGQGNFGSPDMPGSVAASRYIEARLTQFAENFYLTSADYADKEDNYDGRLKEITLFYPTIPGCLITGAQGIAVGFSTYIPPHNINDICTSLLSYIEEGPDGSYLEGFYPDTCEEAFILTDKSSIKEMYLKGQGSISYKAATHYETIDGKSALVVDAFPPGYSKKRLETSYILDAVADGSLELINESKEGIRYVFLSSDMEILKSVEERLTNAIGYRFYIEHRGVIKLYSLKEIYDTFLEEKTAFIIRKYTHLHQKVMSELSYVDILLLFKQDREYIRTMIDKTSEEVIQDIVEKYHTTDVIARRLISSSIKSLLADNVDKLLEQKKKYQDEVNEYQSYIEQPLQKVVKDIHELQMMMKSDRRKAIHIEDKSSDYEHVYEGKKILIQADALYILGHEDNTYELVYGADLKGRKLPDKLVTSADYSYYLFYDEKGVCGVSRDTVLKGWSKLKSDHLVGIIGTADFKDIKVLQGNGKEITLYDWVVRQRASYIELSKDGQPDIVIDAPSPFKG